eukprot:230466_1
MTSEIDPYLHYNWKPAEIDCINLAKAFIKEFSIDTFLESFFNGLESFNDPLKSQATSFVNKHIFNSKPWTDQEQSITSDAISFAPHDEISDTIMKQCRVFEEDMEIKCVTIHSDDELHKRAKKLKAAMNTIKQKMCCNQSEDATNAPCNKYLITTWSLHGNAEIEQQMEMEHCLKFETKDPTPAHIQIDSSASYISIIHKARINIISRQHLITNNITEIDTLELQREGVVIDDYPNIFDVQWFYNKRFSQNQLLGVVLNGGDCFKFIVVDCKNKRVRRREIQHNSIDYQFLKYPLISDSNLWGACNPSTSKEMSIGIMGSQQGSLETGFKKFAQYYLSRHSNNQSKSWVKASQNGMYLAHFSGMSMEKIQYTKDRKNSYRLGIIKVPQHVTLDDSDVTITFRSKPCGFTIHQDTNCLNAQISKVADHSPYVTDGLKVGLWIHTVNMKVVDNNPYKTILGVLRRAPVPLTIGFKTSPPKQSLQPERLGTRFWYNTGLSLPNGTICNGIYWLNNEIAVCVIGPKLYVLGHKKGARSRNKVLQIWMNDAYGTMNTSKDIGGIVHEFVGFDLDKVYNIPDLKYATNNTKDDTAVLDFYFYKNESIYCVYQNDKRENKLIVL